MRKPHRKQLLAWLLTAVLLLTNLPVSVLSEEITENPIQAEAAEQDESETVEEPDLPDSLTEETGEPTEPPVSEEPDEMPESGSQSETVEIPSDEAMSAITGVWTSSTVHPGKRPRIIWNMRAGWLPARFSTPASPAISASAINP